MMRRIWQSSLLQRHASRRQGAKHRRAMCVPEMTRLGFEVLEQRNLLAVSFDIIGSFTEQLTVNILMP